MVNAQALIAQLADSPEEAAVVALAAAVFGIDGLEPDRAIEHIEATGDIVDRLRALGYDIVAAGQGAAEPIPQ